MQSIASFKKTQKTTDHFFAHILLAFRFRFNLIIIKSFFLLKNKQEREKERDGRPFYAKWNFVFEFVGLVRQIFIYFGRIFTENRCSSLDAFDDKYFFVYARKTLTLSVQEIGRFRFQFCSRLYLILNLFYFCWNKIIHVDPSSKFRSFLWNLIKLCSRIRTTWRCSSFISFWPLGLVDIDFPKPPNHCLSQRSDRICCSCKKKELIFSKNAQSARQINHIYRLVVYND